MTDTDLSMISTDDLATELLSRFDAGLFAGIFRPKLEGNEAQTYGRFAGSAHLIVGLAEEIKFVIFNRTSRKAEIEDGDDATDPES